MTARAGLMGLLAAAAVLAAEGVDAAGLRFHGNGVGQIDRVKIRVDDPANSLPGPPADVGATDFTIELWLRAFASENTAPAVSCGSNINWIFGNIVLDRDRYNQDRKFGLSIAGGRLVWGVSGQGTGDFTVCGTTSVLDGAWHHVAVQRRRSDGWMWLYVDGLLQAQGNGPDGDVSYPDDGVPGPFCDGPCLDSDPFLVIAAEKHDAGPAYPSFAGWVDEVRLSTVLRYTVNFPPPTGPFATDGATAALYHLDEGQGASVGDASGAPGGPSPGQLRLGGLPPGPVWSALTPFDAAAPCELSPVLAGVPPVVSRGQTVAYTASVDNTCALSLGFDTLRLVASGPVQATLDQYLGPPVTLGGGQVAAQQRTQGVPLGTPVGAYTVSLVVTRGGLDVALASVPVVVQ